MLDKGKLTDLIRSQIDNLRAVKPKDDEHADQLQASIHTLTILSDLIDSGACNSSDRTVALTINRDISKSVLAWADNRLSDAKRMLREHKANESNCHGHKVCEEVGYHQGKSYLAIELIEAIQAGDFISTLPD